MIKIVELPPGFATPAHILIGHYVAMTCEELTREMKIEKLSVIGRAFKDHGKATRRGHTAQSRTIDRSRQIDAVAQRHHNLAFYDHIVVLSGSFGYIRPGL